MNLSHNNAISHNDQTHTIAQQTVTQQTTGQQSSAVTKSILRSITPENSPARTATIAATAESLRQAPSRRVTFTSVDTIHPIPNRKQLKLADAQAQIQQLQAKVAALQAQLTP